jgi:hypothetical protein
VGFEGDPVHDRGAESGVGEGAGPFGERGVRRDRDRGAFLAFGEHLEQQLGAAAVEFEVAQLIEAEQVDPAVAGDGAGEMFVVGGFDEFVDQGGGGDVADAVAGLGGGDPQPDQQVRLPGPRIADQAQGLPGADPGALGQGVDQPGVDERVGGEVEVVEAFRAGEPCLADQSSLAPVFAFVALDREQLDQESFVAGLLAGGGLGHPRVVFADGGQPQDPAGLLDRGVRGGIGQLVTTGGSGHELLVSSTVCASPASPPSGPRAGEGARRRVRSWS